MPREKQKQRQSGMKVGAVSLWLLILLSERPMYGYEIIKELEKRFSGYWKPKTGTIYPALEKIEQDKLVTSQKNLRAYDQCAESAGIIIPVDPIAFKFLYAKENHKFEIHMELEWTPK